MLISNAEIYRGGHGSVRVAHGKISEIGALTPNPGERVIDAAGGALLPGLNDHHLHLLSLAAADASVPCGPPHVNSAEDLIAALRDAHQGANDAQADVWIRGIGYHECVAGKIDRAWLDRHAGPGPVRIQHRSGRLWIVNSDALQAIRLALQRLPQSQRPSISTDGRLYDIDPALHLLRDAARPAVDSISAKLASFGVSGFTDMTPNNDIETLNRFARLQRDGRLLQHVRVGGRLNLPQNYAASAPAGTRLHSGATKIHLHESNLPRFQTLCETIAARHAGNREVAIHCVTQVELVFALAALREAEPLPGDRIEHASVTPPELLEQIGAAELTVVTQPNFISERGDAYLTDVPPSEHPWLYRCRSFLDHGIALAGGTDAPFGHCDPWRAMAAAVQRETADKCVLGETEALSPEQALDLFLGALDHPARPRRITRHAAADLCVLDVPWSEARQALTSSRVRATVRAGELIFDRVDEAPA
jgi:predicted amidohydrolase YtcJ